MLLLRKPSATTLGDFLAAQSRLDLTYAAVGATAAVPPAGYVVDHTRIKLGAGEGVFHAAKAALECWEQFRLGWVEAIPQKTTLRTGEVVALVARIFGLWWLNACRIVYVVEETEPVRRFGFAYGTLPEHAESGEERFLIEWDRTDESVWYDILAFSDRINSCHDLVIRWLAEYRSDLPVSRLPSCCKGRVFSEEIRILTLSFIAGATVSEFLRIGIRRQQIRHLRLAMCPFPLRLVFDLVAGSVARLLASPAPRPVRPSAGSST